ncbi:phosphatase 2C-like domain-containing protein [Dipodascopsis tothii]|uniref:phosphatase 2C-like domain-containing protein n=1 Tax=Dipodascopsis tothii TaxID=44089 RepID=UPI0034CF1F4D
MEDVHTVVYDFGTGRGGAHRALARIGLRDRGHVRTGSTDAEPRDGNDAGYFAVFDGHAGKAAADWCGKNLHLLLEEHLARTPAASVPETLDRTFTEADSVMARLAMKNAGCTAAVAVLRWEDKPVAAAEPSPHAHFLRQYWKHAPAAADVVRERILYTANAGDARIVLCRRGAALRLSYDHKGTDPAEIKRIQDAGGLVVAGRVNGVLAVTRALGDAYIKSLVTGHPYTTETYLTPDDEFVILACDGLWDVCSDQAAVDLVRPIADPDAAAKALVDHALRNFSTDNITCMVVRFDKQMGDILRASHAAHPTASDPEDPLVATTYDDFAVPGAAPPPV